jgi:proteasome accessory factor B
VEFGYKKLDAKAFEKRTVEPWHLACVSGQWYLLGSDRNRKARRIFELASYAEGLGNWSEVFEPKTGRP